MQKDIVQFDDYPREALYRDKRRGSGVVLYIQKHILHNVIMKYSVITDNYKSLATTNCSFVVAVLYRPLSGSLPTLYNLFEELGELLLTYNVPDVTVGEFNINLRSDGTSCSKFHDLEHSAGFINVINAQIRITMNSNTLIDLCLTSCFNDDVFAGVLSTGISDHMPLFFFIHTKRKVTENQSFRRCITDRGISHFHALLSNLVWDDVFSTGKTDNAYNLFHNKVFNRMRQHFPSDRLLNVKRLGSHGLQRNCLRELQIQANCFINL